MVLSSWPVLVHFVCDEQRPIHGHAEYTAEALSSAWPEATKWPKGTWLLPPLPGKAQTLFPDLPPGHTVPGGLTQNADNIIQQSKRKLTNAYR